MKIKIIIITLGYRLPMTWPFLGAVGATPIAPTAQSSTIAPTQQLVLAPRTTQRRRYTNLGKIKKCHRHILCI